jgi:threonine synthase
MKCCDAARQPAYPFAKIPEGSRIVCTVTGHGLKDPDISAPDAANLKTIAANEDAVLRAIDF